MSAEGRERVRQAKIRRWVKLKGSSKANLNATVAPLPKGEEEGRKGCLIGFGAEYNRFRNQKSVLPPGIPLRDRQYPRQMGVGALIRQQLPGERSNSESSAGYGKRARRRPSVLYLWSMSATEILHHPSLIPAVSLLMQ
jgi:hypothetical protein